MEEKKYIPHPYELFGVECHRGWYGILKPVFDYVEQYNADKEEDKKIRFNQVKEKWSTLDIYVNFQTPELTKLIEEAEEKSDYTCEECGSTENIGKRLNGWVTTMCEGCVKKEAQETNIKQLWERYSDGKRFWVHPDGNFEPTTDRITYY